MVMRRGLSPGAFAAAVTLAATLAAQAPIDPTKLGPQVGERGAPLSLPDQHGAVTDLSKLAGPNGTMLVFFRSADW